MAKKAVVMKGDGIGPEVVDSMINILKECNLQSELIHCDAGSEQWEQNGCKDTTYIPESTMKSLEETDACFKGPTTTIPNQVLQGVWRLALDKSLNCLQT